MPLNGRTVLLVEDEAMLALDIEMALCDAGADVVGPVVRLRDGLALSDDHLGNVDAAILDVDLRGEDVFPLADKLRRLNVPFLFHTGHGERVELMRRYGEIPVCQKPVRIESLVSELEHLVN